MNSSRIAVETPPLGASCARRGGGEAVAVRGSGGSDARVHGEGLGEQLDDTHRDRHLGAGSTLTRLDAGAPDLDGRRVDRRAALEVRRSACAKRRSTAASTSRPSASRSDAVTGRVTTTGQRLRTPDMERASRLSVARSHRFSQRTCVSCGSSTPFVDAGSSRSVLAQEDGVVDAVVEVPFDSPAGSVDECRDLGLRHVALRPPRRDHVAVADPEVDVGMSAGLHGVTDEERARCGSTSPAAVRRRRLPSQEPPSPRLPHSNSTAAHSRSSGSSCRSARRTSRTPRRRHTSAAPGDESTAVTSSPRAWR